MGAILYRNLAVIAVIIVTEISASLGNGDEPAPVGFRPVDSGTQPAWYIDAVTQGKNYKYNATNNPAYECIIQTTKDQTTSLQSCFNRWMYRLDQNRVNSFGRVVACQPSSGLGLCYLQYGELGPLSDIKTNCDAYISSALSAATDLYQLRKDCPELNSIKSSVNCICKARECKAPPARAATEDFNKPAAALCGGVRMAQSFVTFFAALIVLTRLVRDN